MKKQFYQEYKDNNPNSSTYNQTKWKHIPQKDNECGEDTVCIPNWQIDKNNNTVCQEGNKYERWIDLNRCKESPEFKIGKLIEKNSPNCPGYDPCKNITEENWIPLNEYKCDGTIRKQKYQNNNYPCPTGSEQFKWLEVNDPNEECKCYGQSTAPVYDIRTDELKCDDPTQAEATAPGSPSEVDKVLRRKYKNSNPCYEGIETFIWKFESYDGCDCQFVEDGAKRCEGTTSYQYWKNTNKLRTDCVKSKTIIKENDPDCGYVPEPKYVFEVTPTKVEFKDF